LSITKSFRLSERFRLQARAEMINAFNRQNFGVNNGGNITGMSRTASSSSSTFLDFNQTEAAGRFIRMRLKIEF